MLEPAPSLVNSFNRILKSAGETKHRQLRCVWGEMDHGVQRWVIQAHLPNDIHAQCIQEFGTLNEDRYEDKTITDQEGRTIGHYRHDKVNPWALIHIIQDTFYDLDDPRGYRQPGERDLSVIWNWMYEFDSIVDQMRTVRDEQRKKDAANKADRNRCLAEDIRDSRSLFEDPEIMDMHVDAMSGTELPQMANQDGNHVSSHGTLQRPDAVVKTVSRPDTTHNEQNPGRPQ